MGRCAGLAIIAFILIAAPATGAGWLAPTVVGQSATTDDTSPVAASAPDGSAAIAWLATLPGGKHAVRVAVRGPSGAFGAEQSFPEGGTSSAPSDVHVAIDAHGDVAVAWIADGVGGGGDATVGWDVRAPVAIPEHPYGANEFALGIDGGGTATVAVAESRSVDDMSCSTIPKRIYLRYVAYPVSVAGAVAPLQTIFNANADCLLDFGSLGDPDIAVNSRGDAVGSIQTNSGGYGVRVMSRALAGGAFGNQANLSNAYESSVALAPNGHFVAAGIAASRAVSVAGIAGQAPGATQMLSEAPPDASAASAAIDAGGKGTIAWQATAGADAYRVHARDVLPSGAPGPVLAELSPEITDGAGLGPRIAVGGPGSAFALWRQHRRSERALRDRRVAPRAGRELRGSHAGLRRHHPGRHAGRRGSRRRGRCDRGVPPLRRFRQPDLRGPVRRCRACVVGRRSRDRDGGRSRVVRRDRD